MSTSAPKAKEPPWWAGGMASVMATCVSHPVDLLKVRMQTSVGKTGGYGTVIKSIVASEGVLGLYAGLSSSVLRQLTYGTTRFAAYDFRWYLGGLSGHWRPRAPEITSQRHTHDPVPRPLLL